MTSFTTAQLRPQSYVLNIPHFLAMGAAALLASASILTNVSSAIARQPDLAGKIVGGSIAAAVAVLSTIALSASLAALARRQFVIAALAATAFSLSTAFSVSSALGVLGGARLQSSISHAHTEGQRTRLEFERRNTVTELATIATTRSPEEITPELARRLSIPGVDGCTSINGPISRQHCPMIAALQGELARSNHRSALSGLIAHYDRDIAALGAPALANRDAAALAHVLTALGFSTKPDTINTVLMLLGVLILECGAALSLATAQALRSIAADMPTIRNVTPIECSAALAPVAGVASVIAVECPNAASAPSKTVQGAATKILQLAHNNGGTLRVSSQRQLGRMIDTSHPTASRALAIVATMGAVVSNEAGELVVKLVG